MRKFKLFMASVLTYFMAISILPTGLVEIVANAAENEYSTFIKSDYYLRSNALYKDKVLVAYTKPGFNAEEINLSLVEGEKELPLKVEKGVNYVRIVSDKKSKAAIQYFSNERYSYYEEFDFETLKFKSITEKEFNNYENNNLDDFYNYGTYSTLIQGSQENRDEIIGNALDKINKSNDKYNFTIADKNYDSASYGVKYFNEKGYLEILMYERGVYNKDLNIKNDILDFKIKEYDSMTNSYKYYAGFITDKNVYTEEYLNSQEFDNRYFEMDYKGKESLFLFQYLKNGNKKLIEVKDNEIITNQIIDFPTWSSTKIDDLFYVYDVTNKKLKIYKHEGMEYKISGELYSLAASLSFLKKSNVPMILEKENDKVYISRITNEGIKRVTNVTNELSKFYDISKDVDLSIEEVAQDTYFISTMQGFMIIRKSTNEEQTNPETPKPQEPSTPVTPTNPGNDNGGTKPSEDKVVTEVSKIKPNDKNDIAVKTTEGTKSIEVVVKDIEAIKNGNGSLNIVTDNRVKINLPLSAIDKSLLEGAKDVTIKLDIIENSDIVKNIKGVNKVFDFNLIINKEDGTTNVHNFKEGLVEVKLNLTDKDLEGLNKDKIVVYYYNDSTKAFEEMETSVNGNEVTFKTPHFSKYVIAEKTETKNGETPANGGTNGSNTSTDKKTEAGKGQLPETGARVSNTTILVLAVGMLAIGGAMFFRKRKHA
ncbi:LPXTG cell wall anchor domain-containing protein [Clostridium sp. HCS.1]|uniref:LPXTG cell wall anchor domain-containing protein n=1 Tax=Clostridium sp. HCS.1 TaxID=3238594 RepID=UPI003A10347C